MVTNGVNNNTEMLALIGRLTLACAAIVERLPQMDPTSEKFQLLVAIVGELECVAAELP
ncbi:MAG: hypothetical protein LIP77_10835 [Planctomycetes bacterium]|nr:hypothetical protein [Planctomycetota bacterium]